MWSIATYDFSKTNCNIQISATETICLVKILQEREDKGFTKIWLGRQMDKRGISNIWNVIYIIKKEHLLNFYCSLIKTWLADIHIHNSQAHLGWVKYNLWTLLKKTLHLPLSSFPTQVVFSLPSFVYIGSYSLLEKTSTCKHVLLIHG